MLQQLDLFLSRKNEVHKRTDQIFFRERLVEVQRRPYQRSLNVLVRPNGKLKVTAGRTVPAKVIQNFLLKNSEWIEQSLGQFENLRRRYPLKLYREGEKFLFKGLVRELAFAPTLAGRATIEEVGQKLLVRAPRGQECATRNLIRRFYERQGRMELTRLVKQCSEEMGLTPKELKFRSLKSQWGSCTTRGKVTLNWRLVVFPEELCKYVVIHELAHLKHPNHSQKFWDLVEEYCPNYKSAKKYLANHHYEVDFLAKKSDLYVE